MSYMNMLEGNTRTNLGNVERKFTIKSSNDAQRLAQSLKRTDDDSHEFRTMRSMMKQSHCKL